MGTVLVLGLLAVVAIWVVWRLTYCAAICVYSSVIRWVTVVLVAARPPLSWRICIGSCNAFFEVHVFAHELCSSLA